MKFVINWLVYFVWWLINVCFRFFFLLVAAPPKQAAQPAKQAAPAKKEDPKKAPAAAKKEDPKKAAPAKKADPKKAAAPAKTAPAKAAPAKAATAKAAPAKAAAPAPAPAPAAPAPAQAAAAAAPAEQKDGKTVKAVAAKPQPKKRGVNAKAAAASGRGRVSKKQLRGKGLKKKKIQLRFAIDCTNIAEDSIMDVADFVSIIGVFPSRSFNTFNPKWIQIFNYFFVLLFRWQEKYLLEHIKVNGKVNNLGNNVSLERQKMKVIVNSDVHFSKAYLKYLTKRYLKKNSLRDWIRVVANEKDSYELRYFRISSNDDDEEDNE